MKKLRYIVPAAVLIITLAAFSACSGGDQYKDGTYYAENADFAGSGWKETVEITIENGKLSKINWDAIYKDNSIPIRKKQYSKSGLYGMLAAGAKNEWYDQAKMVEQFVLENGIDSLVLDGDGYTDTVASCSIHVDSFDSLLRQCFEQAKK